MKFETPVVEVKKFNLVDVLTTSGDDATTSSTSPVEEESDVYCEWDVGF